MTVCPTCGAHPTRARNAAFTDAEVEAIRTRYAAGGVSPMALALELGVEQGAICKLVRGLTYPDAPGPITRCGRGKRP